MTTKEKGFQAWYKEKPQVIEIASETIGYVGCIHGGDEQFIKMLWDMTKIPMAHLIFLGDFIGTKSFEELQRLFYNYVNNHSKNELLKDNPNATDEQILKYIGTKPPEPGLTLKEGFLRLRAYELSLEGFPEKEIKKKLNSLKDTEIADEIRRYADFVHYGHYASNLPQKAKQTLASGLKDNAEKILEPVKTMMEKGTKVVMLEGNWDARAPIDFVPGEKTAVPLSKKDRLFLVADYMAEKGISFLSELTTLETKTTFQILAPFDAIINVPKTDLTSFKKKVEKARQANKQIVLAGHGEPNWKIHNLTVVDPVPKGEHAQLIEGYTTLITQLSPDQIVYDHMHDRIVNEKKEIVDDWKYVLEVSGGIVYLVEDPERIGENSNQIIANYIPFREAAIFKNRVQHVGQIEVKINRE